MSDLSATVAVAAPTGSRPADGRPPAGRRRSGAKDWNWAGVLPALVLMVWLLVLPLVSFVSRSFHTAGGQKFTWANYTQIFTDHVFRASLFGSLEIAVLSTALALAVAIPAALHLATATSRMRVLADAVLTFPLSLPGVVIGFFVIVLFGRAGLVPAAAKAVTGDKEFVIAYAMPGLMLAYMYFQLPRVIATLRGAAENLDADLPSVARTLGASRTRAMFTVVLPALRPAILSASSLAVASSLGAYGTVAALSEGFRVLPLDVAEQATVMHNNALASAMAVLLAAISLAFALLSRSTERAPR